VSLSTGIDTLTGVSVTGITKSYTIDDLRGGVSTPDLPALLPLPHVGSNERLSYGYSTESWLESHTVRHRLLERPAEPAHLGEAAANLVDLIDNYLAAIGVLSQHAGAIDIIVRRYEAGIVKWGGVSYEGCDFFVELVVND
jgi:hypothetical protein